MYYVGICDDERAACAQIAEMVYEYDNRNKVGIEVLIWYTGEALYQDMRKNKSVDLLFLDIELVSTDGIQIGRQIRHELRIRMSASPIYHRRAVTRSSCSRSIRSTFS